jgi:hypothetical protein
MLPDQIDAIIRAWPLWTRAERRRMDALVAEIQHYVLTGGGTRLVAKWCQRVLAPQLRARQAPPPDHGTGR